jgi:hypothetical protein
LSKAATGAASVRTEAARYKAGERGAAQDART